MTSVSSPSRHQLISDLRGAARLATEATEGVISVVDGMHGSIQNLSPPLGRSAVTTTGLTGFIYRSIQRTTHWVGRGLDAGLGSMAMVLPPGESSARRDAYRSVVNGVCGDHLVDTGNPLAIDMSIHRDGREIRLQNPGRAFFEARGCDHSRKIALFVHGLCLNDRHWNRNGYDHGASLAAECGYSSLYLRYNTGRRISANGQELSRTLEALVQQWPVAIEELVIIGHSMGGLVARSACHQAEIAGHPWLGILRQLISLGTPHQGAPLERGGHQLQRALGLSPYSVPLTHLVNARSAGINDLRNGVVTADKQHAQLPRGVDCYAMAGVLSENEKRSIDSWIGDGLVPLRSALGQDRQGAQALDFPRDRQWVGYGMGHLDLLSHPDVYLQLRRWIQRPDSH